MVSDWRSVLAVSLNVGGGVRLIKPAKLYICTQIHYKHDEDGRTTPDVCGHGSIPLSHSGNVVTRTGLHTYLNYQITVYLLLFPRKKAIEGRLYGGLSASYKEKACCCFALLFYVHGKHLRSCRDGQLT